MYGEDPVTVSTMTFKTGFDPVNIGAGQKEQILVDI